jgi:putative NIF3 family GTP cyclohydrolase 1 type 2
MPTVGDIANRLEQLAPLAGAEEWDNVGLLVGDRARPVARLMTCLTITPTTAAEAIAQRAELVVVHHPLPFRPLTRVTTDTTVGRLLWDLIGAGVCVYSAHTAFDSAEQGINELWAARLGMRDISPLIPANSADGEVALGAGRYGTLPFGVACGSGGSLLDAARANGCDCLITGEANFHACLEAEANGIGLILCGHYASERFAMERLAEVLASDFPDVDVWASRNECDPLRVR